MVLNVQSPGDQSPVYYRTVSPEQDNYFKGSQIAEQANVQSPGDPSPVYYSTVTPAQENYFKGSQIAEQVQGCITPPGVDVNPSDKNADGTIKQGVFTFTCEDGYKMTGTGLYYSSLTCKADGSVTYPLERSCTSTFTMPVDSLNFGYAFPNLEQLASPAPSVVTGQTATVQSVTQVTQPASGTLSMPSPSPTSVLSDVLPQAECEKRRRDGLCIMTKQCAKTCFTEQLQVAYTNHFYNPQPLSYGTDEYNERAAMCEVVIQQDGCMHESMKSFCSGIQGIDRAPPCK